MSDESLFAEEMAVKSLNSTPIPAPAANPSFTRSLLSGAAAGTCVDLVFFPIDTIKTRLQSREGFFKAGGYRGIYRGLGSVVVASAPGASLFFICYDQGKHRLPALAPAWMGLEESGARTHLVSASIGECAACLVRVPSEVVKQRVQTGQFPSSLEAFTKTIARDGFRGLYRGFGTTIGREIPFTALQFPLYEMMKRRWAKARGQDRAAPWQGAICGSLAGAFAAATTTPLDVLKTRLMLAQSKVSVRQVVLEIAADGPKAFFRGVVPRTLWISFGGAVFLGMYETVSAALL